MDLVFSRGLLLLFLQDFEKKKLEVTLGYGSRLGLKVGVSRVIVCCISF